jgi:4-amino-4-deoxy-L-arabinose transferase-like glycosyltransferase
MPPPPRATRPCAAPTAYACGVETHEAQQGELPQDRHFEWWHHSHPTFAGITGFFAGMLYVTAVPGAFAGILRLLFSYETAERLFPFVLLALALPIAMLVKRKTRRFAQFMFVGMVVTTLVVLGVVSLVLYFLVDA